jgi:type IV pilus assembly protein PilC
MLLRVPMQEQILFAKHLSVMIRAGMPLLDSMRLIRKQTGSKSLAKILDQLISDVSNGQFLSTSMERYKNVFGDFTVNIIRVGEAGGILYENLEYLAQELKKRHELKRRVIGALIYPAIVLMASSGIIGVLTIYVFPKILPVFQSLRVTLPLSTRILIAASGFLINWGFMVAIVVVVTVIALWIAMVRIKLLRFFVHRLLLVIPIVKKISRSYNLTNFCRTLGLLLKSDIKVVEALSITADTLSNVVYRRHVREIGSHVTKGEEISQNLSSRPDLFPIMVSQMVAIGESTGNLSESLLYLADFYEDNLNEVTKDLSTVLEPLMMILMGLVVGFIALSIMTPIYEVTKGLKVR